MKNNVFYINKKDLDRLKIKNSYINFLVIFFDYIQIVGAIFFFYIFPSPIVYFFSIFLIGSRMRGLENLLHEASHNHLAKNRFLNKWVAMIFCSFPIFNSLYAYTQSHLTHHRWLGDQHRDPDLIKYKMLKIDKLPSTRHFLFTRVLKIIFLVNVPIYLFHNIKNFNFVKGTPFQEHLIKFIYYSLLITIISFFNLWKPFLIFWIVPFFSTFQFIRYLAEVSEHGGLYHNEEEINMTRNNLYHPVLRFFLYPHNDAYHLTHHLFPSVPHYNLRTLHEMLLEREKYAEAHHCFGLLFSNKGRTTFQEMISNN